MGKYNSGYQNSTLIKINIFLTFYNKQTVKARIKHNCTLFFTKQPQYQQIRKQTRTLNYLKTIPVGPLLSFVHLK